MNSPPDHRKDCDVNSNVGRCELDENLEILKALPVFSGIPTDRLRLYAYLSRRERYQPGQFLFRQGDHDNRGYIVIQGKARVIREFQDHFFLLNELGPGDFFGGLALLSDVARLFSVKAQEPLECLTIDRETFKKLVMQFPEVALKVLDVMIRRIAQMEEKLLQMKSDECFYG